ncbi:MAG TPA: hypothetical protein ENK11_05495 [Phycisphaerales bacterium]|nr:hypothetical protein [Phycisphaerales bacterium]
MPESPFGGSVAKKPWSKCGQAMCSCQPDETDLQQSVVCPLCVADGSKEKKHADGVSWTRRAERIDDRVPMAVEFLTASFLLRLWSEPVWIAPPPPRGIAPGFADRPRVTWVPAVEPPPPRPLAA